MGEGGDPYGFVPLISEVRGPTALAGFRLERILNWVGKLDAKGEIAAEADEVPIPPRGSYAAFIGGEDASSGVLLLGWPHLRPRRPRLLLEKNQRLTKTPKASKRAGLS